MREVQFSKDLQHWFTMKAPTRIVEHIPAPTGGGVSMNTVLVLIVINCLLLVFQISSNAPTIYERGWWPPTACENIMTTTIEDSLNLTSLDLSHGDVRSFHPHGIATRLIVEVGSYRNGPNTFSSVVMTSKRLNQLHKILYECEWVSSGDRDTAPVKVKARAIKPDWNMGRLYGTMMLVCEFGANVGTDGEGGRLVLTAGYGESDVFRSPERFVVLTEMRGEYNASRFEPPYPYEMTFCGSPLYGNISPQRVREWIAYHAWFFGEKTFFIFQDAGGIHEDVYRVLKPWIDLGRVRVQNLRQAEVYEGYYHHQFTMLNDCMLLSQTLANWTFFFDVDEFLYIPESGGAENKPTIDSILAEKARNNVTQILFQNVKVSDGLCLKQNRQVSDSEFLSQISRKWGFEKLVYANCDYGWTPQESRKYAVQPQRVWATGVHYSEHVKLGKSEDMDATTLRGYHFHNTVNSRTELCKAFPHNPTGDPNSLNVRNCTVDLSIANLAPTIKRYELTMVGEQPFIL